MSTSSNCNAVSTRDEVETVGTVGTVSDVLVGKPLSLHQQSHLLDLSKKRKYALHVRALIETAIEAERELEEEGKESIAEADAHITTHVASLNSMEAKHEELRKEQERLDAARVALKKEQQGAEQKLVRWRATLAVEQNNMAGVQSKLQQLLNQKQMAMAKYGELSLEFQSQQDAQKELFEKEQCESCVSNVSEVGEDALMANKKQRLFPVFEKEPGAFGAPKEQTALAQWWQSYEPFLVVASSASSVSSVVVSTDKSMETIPVWEKRVVFNYYSGPPLAPHQVPLINPAFMDTSFSCASHAMARVPAVGFAFTPYHPLIQIQLEASLQAFVADSGKIRLVDVVLNIPVDNSSPQKSVKYVINFESGTQTRMDTGTKRPFYREEKWVMRNAAVWPRSWVWHPVATHVTLPTPCIGGDFPVPMSVMDPSPLTIPRNYFDDTPTRLVRLHVTHPLFQQTVRELFEDPSNPLLSRRWKLTYIYQLHNYQHLTRYHTTRRVTAQQCEYAINAGRVSAFACPNALVSSMPGADTDTFAEIAPIFHGTHGQDAIQHIVRYGLNKRVADWYAGGQNSSSASTIKTTQTSVTSANINGTVHAANVTASASVRHGTAYGHGIYVSTTPGFAVKYAANPIKPRTPYFMFMGRAAVGLTELGNERMTLGNLVPQLCSSSTSSAPIHFHSATDEVKQQYCLWDESAVMLDRLVIFEYTE